MFEGLVQTKSKLTIPAMMFYLHSPEGVKGLAQPCWLKIAKFSLPPAPVSFSALAQCNPFQIYGKALQILKPKSSRQPMVILACTIFDWSTHVTDGRTDGQNCDG